MTFWTFYKAGKFAKDWKKITENSLIREKSSITGPKSALKTRLTCKWRLNFGSMFLEFELMIAKCIATFSRNYYRKKSNLKDTGNF